VPFLKKKKQGEYLTTTETVTIMMM